MDANTILERFVHELAVVVGALSASETTVADATPQSTGQWTAAITFAGPGNGICTVALDEAGVLAVTRALVGGDDVPDEALAGTVQELLTQAASALQNGSEIRGLSVEVSAAAFYEGLALPADAFTRSISSSMVTVPLIVSIDGSLAEAAAAPEQAVQAAAPSAAAIAAEPGVAERIDVILDIDLPLVVRFGRTDMPLRALTRLSPGSVIELHRSPDDPVELLVSDRVIARGEVVIVGGNYGVRILDVVSPSERMRSMEVGA